MILHLPMLIVLTVMLGGFWVALLWSKDNVLKLQCTVRLYNLVNTLFNIYQFFVINSAFPVLQYQVIQFYYCITLF